MTPVRLSVRLAASVALSVSLTSSAVDEVGLRLGGLEGEGWSLQGLEFRYLWVENVPQLQIRVDSLVLPDPVGVVQDVNIHCMESELSADRILCDAGRVSARSGLFDIDHAGLRLEYHHDQGRLQLQLQEVGLGQGLVSAHATLDEGAWSVDMNARELESGIVLDIAAKLGYRVDLSASGKIDARVMARGNEVALQSLEWQGDFNGLEFTDSSGRYAGEGLRCVARLSLERKQAVWLADIDLPCEEGGLYIDPVFVDISQFPLELRGSMEWGAKGNTVTLHNFELSQPGILHLQARGHADPGPPVLFQELTADLTDGQLPGLYEVYLQPFVSGSAVAELETSGRVDAQLVSAKSMVSRVLMNLEQVSVNERGGLFGLDGLQGVLEWADTEETSLSRLQWQGGHVYNIGLGAAEIAIESSNDHASLQRPARIPVLDGELQLEKLSIGAPGTSRMQWNIEGILTPISMRELSLALGWPELAGKLSGVIPDVHYEGGSIEVGGVLLVRIFDGEITLRNLKLDQPFGIIPRMWLDAAIKNLDLHTLTRTFSFGKIEGKLGGAIRNLVMEDWRPFSFDAYLATPPDDQSRHRISQKAVDNLSSIGGVSGVLSRSFLRFLEDFPYDRLGLSCRLENGVCYMGGVARATNGYYIVKGSTLPPRLDVIGYADRVDWDTLIQRLVAATRAQEAELQ